MSVFKKLFNRIFKKQTSQEQKAVTEIVEARKDHDDYISGEVLEKIALQFLGQAPRFNVSPITPGQVAVSMGTLKTAWDKLEKQRKIKPNAKLQHRKKKSQNKNWQKWRVCK